MRANSIVGSAHNQRDKSSAFVLAIWRHQPGEYFCISIADRYRERWHDEFFHRQDFDEVPGYILKHRERLNVYFATNGFEVPTRRAPVPGFFLYADLDEVKPWGLKLEPTFAIRTSPGSYQAWWRCKETITRQINKRLTYSIGADKCHDMSHVLRIPGTLNLKPAYKPTPVVSLIWDGGPTYSIDEVKRHLAPEKKRRADTQARAVVRVKESASVKELRHAYGVRNKFIGQAGDRSAAIYGIWSPMVEGGATLDQIMRVLEASWSWQSKLADEDGWCDDEIERIKGEIE